jgi:hypothetical protein
VRGVTPPADPAELDPALGWTDMLGPIEGAVIALVDEEDGPGGQALRDAGAEVLPLDLDGLAELPAGSCDVVVLLGGRQGLATEALPRVAGSAARVLRPDGVLLVLVASPSSPLAWLDAAARRGRPGGRSGRRVRRALARAGVPPVVEYGVLRSVNAPSTWFSLRHPRHAQMVLAASNTLNTGVRRRAVSGLAAAARLGLAGPLVPAFGLFCSPGRPAHEPALGRIAPGGAHEAKLLLGDPLREVVKVYGSSAVAAAESAALEQVHRVWPGLAPPLLAREGPRRVRLGWVEGRSLSGPEVAGAAGERWLRAAAAVLGELHRRLGPDQDGGYLLHGDLWLGNLLVDRAGTDVVGLIDWTDTRRGEPQEDLRFLVDAWAGPRRLAAQDVAGLRAAVDDAYAAARGRG